MTTALTGLRFYVYYASEFLISFESNRAFQSWRSMQPNCWPEVYNEAYVYDSANHAWWKMDLTPVLLDDVPKGIRVLALLMS